MVFSGTTTVRPAHSGTQVLTFWRRKTMVGIIFQIWCNFSFPQEKQTCEREEDVTCSIHATGVEGETAFSSLLLLLLLLLLLSLFPPVACESVFTHSRHSWLLRNTFFPFLYRSVQHHIDASVLTDCWIVQTLTTVCRRWKLWASLDPLPVWLWLPHQLLPASNRKRADRS